MGWYCAWQDYSAMLGSLTARRHVVAPDLRGHWASGRTPGAYLVTDYARDIITHVERHVHGGVVYGHSLGAMVALAVAAALPDRVVGAVLEDPPFETMGSRLASNGLLAYSLQMQALAQARLPVPELAKRLADVRQRPPDGGVGPRLGDVRDAASLRFGAECLAAADPDVYTPIVAGHWLQGYDWPAMLGSVHCPVLVLQADPKLGGMLIDADAALLQQRLADCTLVKVPGVGHHIHWQQTDATLRLLHGFLDSLHDG